MYLHIFYMCLYRYVKLWLFRYEKLPSKSLSAHSIHANTQTYIPAYIYQTLSPILSWLTHSLAQLIAPAAAANNSIIPALTLSSY